MLSKVCPNITFMQYKVLYNECHELITYSEADYYGGRESFSYHKCDLKKLWDKMNEMRLI